MRKQRTSEEKKALLARVRNVIFYGLGSLILAFADAIFIIPFDLLPGGVASIGIVVEGYDNTFTNIRISGAKIGVKLVSAGNYLRNIHPLFLVPEFYDDSIGFLIENGNNWMDFCYSDQYATGFQIGDQHCVFDNCFVYWYSNYGKKHTAIKSTGKFNLTVTNFTVGMGEWNKAETNYVLEVAEDGGNGVFNNISIDDTGILSDNKYLEYVKD